MAMKPTLAIGDVHGHFDRISLLLEQEGIINANGERIRSDCEVIQLGDLGHFGKGGSPTGDMLCYEYADKWFDGMCWGNHDRPLLDDSSVFAGYERPDRYVYDCIDTLMRKNKVRMAWAKNGFLLTHAGLHKALPPKSANVSEDAEDIAKWIRETPECWHAISSLRGGRHPYGGVLWRDAREKLNGIVPQVFGHSARDKVRQYQTQAGTSYCVDVGSPTNGRLAGIWLPECRIVEVKV